MAAKKKGLGAKGLGINALINTEMEDIVSSKPAKKKTEAEKAVVKEEPKAESVKKEKAPAKAKKAPAKKKTAKEEVKEATKTE